MKLYINLVLIIQTTPILSSDVGNKSLGPPTTVMIILSNTITPNSSQDNTLEKIKPIS